MKTSDVLMGAVAVALSSFACAAASATVLYDNLSATSGESESAGFLYGTGPLYDSFSTGTSSFDFVDVTLALTGNPRDGGLWGAALLADDSGAPGSAIYSWNYLPDSILTLSGTVTLGASVLLNPDSRYWIVVASLDSLLPTEVQWSYSSDISGVGVAGEYWADDGGQYSNGSGHGPFQMAVATPEPSTWAMMLLGFAGLGFAAYRRTQRGAASLPAAV
jgi:hypothetical protein